MRTIRSHVFPGLSLVWPRHTMPPTGNPCPFFPHSIRLCRTNRINPRVVNSKGTASNMSSDFCYPVERALCKRQAAKKDVSLLCVCVSCYFVACMEFFPNTSHSNWGSSSVSGEKNAEPHHFSVICFLASVFLPP